MILNTRNTLYSVHGSNLHKCVRFRFSTGTNSSKTALEDSSIIFISVTNFNDYHQKIMLGGSKWNFGGSFITLKNLRKIFKKPWVKKRIILVGFFKFIEK